MFKKVFLPFLVFLLFIIGLYVFIEKPYLPKMPNTNIFSEMYFQEKDGILEKVHSIKGVKVISDRDSLEPDSHVYNYVTSENYKSIHIAVYNNDHGQNPDINLFITITETLSVGNVTAQFSYKGSSARLSRNLEFSGEDSQSLTHEELLATNGYSFESLEKKMTTILNDKVLKDWTRVYNSKYSPDNWGDVKVEDWTVEK